MLSVMTVVLPQHSKNSTSFTASATSASSSSAVAAQAAVTTTTTTAVAKVAGRSSAAAGRCQNCECLCGVDSMTKNSLPQRCPFLKGYMAEPRRHPHFVDRPPPHHRPPSAREWDSVREAACFWRDKYDRLYENQRRLQKVNENLEEKLLKIAEKFEGEKSDLTRDVSDLTSRLVEARLSIAELEEENEQYRNDCNIAVRLLQCKPSNFVAHKFNSLPADFQVKVKRHLAGRSARPQRGEGTRPSSSSSLLLDQCPPDVRTIKVSVPTLPPAAMVYSVNKATPPAQTHQSPTANAADMEEVTPDHVSAAIIAKVLEERSLERKTASSFKKQRTREEHGGKEQQEQRNASTQTDHAIRPIAVPYCNRCHAHMQKSATNRSAESDTLRMTKETVNSTETAI